MRRRKTGGQRRLAERQIQEYFELANRVYKQDFGLACRYVKLARKTAMKFKVPIPREYKRSFCRYCGLFFVPSVNCRVRLSGGKVLYHCLNCRRTRRFVVKG